MKKLKIIIPIIILILIGFIYYFYSNRKFYLDDEYYNNSTGYMEIDSNKLNELQNNKSSFIVFTYNEYCTLKIPCENIFKQFMEDNEIAMYSIPFTEMQKTFIYNEVKYAPSVIIVKKGKIVSYLDANKDEDLNKYQDVNEFSNWINKYVYFKIN
jgi:hypothetical protein